MDQIIYTLLINLKTIAIGITNNKNWFVAKGNRIIDVYLNDTRELVVWLPILEDDFSEVFDGLKKMIEMKVQPKNSNELIDSFPTNYLIETALKSNSIYWIPLGLKWLEHIRDKSEFKDSLLYIFKNLKCSQKIRHKSMKFLAEIKRNNL
jgi:hypothetical protein